jgi:hypothetical protein
MYARLYCASTRTSESRLEQRLGGEATHGRKVDISRRRGRRAEPARGLGPRWGAPADAPTSAASQGPAACGPAPRGPRRRRRPRARGRRRGGSDCVRPPTRLTPSAAPQRIPLAPRPPAASRAHRRGPPPPPSPAQYGRQPPDAAGGRREGRRGTSR